MALGMEPWAVDTWALHGEKGSELESGFPERWGASCLSLSFLLPVYRSGLGYVLGSVVTKLTGDWHWALRVSPASFSSLHFSPWSSRDFPAWSGLCHLALYLAP